jgi:phosphoglycolate phosphatase
MIGLVVFDLDGTLIDSRRDLADAANVLIREHGGHPLDESTIVGMVGEGVDLLVSCALAAGGVPAVPPGAVARFMEIYGGRMLVHTRPYPGIPEALEAASRLAPLAVLSNKPRAASREILEGLGIARFFREVYGGDAPFPRKPDSRGLCHLAEVAGRTPAETLLVGDSPIDLQTARAAGTPIALARYGFGYARVTPAMLTGEELFIDRPGEVPRLIEGLRGRALSSDAP